MTQSMNAERFDLSFPVAAERLIPHRPPLRFVDRLVQCSDDSGVVEAVIPTDNLLVDEVRRVDPLVLVELMAQAYAAVKGYRDLMTGQPVRKGYLVGIKRLEVVSVPTVGERLAISVRTVASFGGFAVAEATVIRKDRLIASANLKLWISEDLPSEGTGAP